MFSILNHAEHLIKHGWICLRVDTFCSLFGPSIFKNLSCVLGFSIRVSISIRVRASITMNVHIRVRSAMFEVLHLAWSV